MTSASTDVGLRPVTPLGILAARLDAVCARPDLSPEVAAELAAVRDLAAGFEPYLEQHTSPESPALAALAERTRTAPWSGTLEAEMLSGHVEGRFLAFLVGTTRARRVLEIGMFTGYGALAMAEALPADGELVACELDADVAAFAQECFPDGAPIDVRVGPAADTLAALAAEGQVFDLVFVDADKAGYAGYLDALLDTGLLAEGALVAVDNTLMQGQPWAGERTPNGDAVAAFNARLTADPRVEQVLVPLRDGITLVRRTQS
ncbi:caffeoyl-CoA O-methyltransferase [Klenkia marina]|uniref:Caffeoyl-CoA O-methyltransferase n=1 Tax=Klenkia marina TaxID=1960309 RepID=A0A1G4XIL6_9ACTN|nr:class I SAM-dependent methyltransferase [Klenkia marina]SCX41103.1 caffeoyl-CoA O-methyltransferase [Klenkia marina]